MAELDEYRSAGDSAVVGEQENYFSDEESVCASENGYRSGEWSPRWSYGAGATDSQLAT